MGKRARKKHTGLADETAADGTEGRASADGEASEPERLLPDERLREVSLLVEEVDYVHQLYRWLIHTGEVPKAQDWLKKEPWPHPDYVIDVFGSWEKFLTHAGVPGSPLLARLREADSAAKDLAAREKQAAKEVARVDDLRRQVQTARSAREAVQSERRRAPGADRAAACVPGRRGSAGGHSGGRAARADPGRRAGGDGARARRRGPRAARRA